MIPSNSSSVKARSTRPASPVDAVFAATVSRPASRAAITARSCGSSPGGTGGWSEPDGAPTGRTPITSSSTSTAWRTTRAPSRRSAFAPLLCHDEGEPGVAPTSRPRSAAISAVISDPERSAAEEHELADVQKMFTKLA